MVKPSSSETAAATRAPVEVAPAGRSDALSALAREIALCRICRDRPSGEPLPHEPRPVARPSPTARLLVAGQAPGTRVHATGLPFNDPSGDRLRDWMQVDRDTFYDASRIAIVPMGFCFPGHDRNKGDLPPRRECRQTWHDLIFPLMPQLEVILAIGAHAQAYHLTRLGLPYRRGAPMRETVENWRAYAAASPRVFALPHPSWRNSGWLKRNLWFEAEVLPALRMAVARVV